jgi:hypothetical protein
MTLAVATQQLDTSAVVVVLPLDRNAQYLCRDAGDGSLRQLWGYRFRLLEVGKETGTPGLTTTVTAASFPDYALKLEQLARRL